MCPVSHEGGTQLSQDDPADFNSRFDRAALTRLNPMTLMTARSTRRFVSVALATLLLGVGATNPLSTAAETLQVFILDSENLMRAKNRLQSNDPAVIPAFNKLIRDAERALTSGTLSVVQKELTPPSGDKHD